MVATLIAILVAAVQKVRAASNRTQCQNHLRQLGVAFHSHHDVRRQLPTGGRNDPGLHPTTGKPYTHAIERDDYSWCYQILPFIEMGHLLRESDVTVQTTPVPLLLCPSRRSVQTYHGHAVCDYGGNGGTNNLNGTVIPTGAGKLNLLSISDGAANTILLGERRVNRALLHGTTDSHDNESCMNPGYDGDIIRWASRSSVNIGVAPDLNDPAADPATPHGQFGATHDTGMNTLFVDCSVRAVRYDIDPLLFRHACLRNNGIKSCPE